MLVSLIKNTRIHNFVLPKRVYGNYWVTDFDENHNEQNLINIEATDNGWMLVGNQDVSIMEQELVVPSVQLQLYQFYVLRFNQTNVFVLLYCAPGYDTSNQYYKMVKDSLTIGSSSSQGICYRHSYVSEIHAQLRLVNGCFELTDQHSKMGVYVNQERVMAPCLLESGDIIFIAGLKLVVLNLNSTPMLAINNPNGLVDVMSQYLEIMPVPTNDSNLLDMGELSDVILYPDDVYFHKKPRFKTSLDTLEMKIDPPPSKDKMQEKPVLLTIGPMVTMGMTSMVMGVVALSNVFTKGMSWSSAAPSLVICVAMMLSMILWPIMTRRYEKKRKIKEEALRQEKYGEYIEGKRQLIGETLKRQRQILMDNNLSLGECQQIILKKHMTLWERKLQDDDFLTVTLGTGTRPMKIHIQYPEEHFSMDEDNLKEILNRLGSEPKNLIDVPITLSLYEKYITAVIGNIGLLSSFMDRMILQLLAFQSYDDMKIVMFTSPENASHWEYLKSLSHCWNDDRTLRYFCTSADEMKEVCYHLDREINDRMGQTKNHSSTDKPRLRPHYVILTDCFKMVRGFDFMKNVLEQDENLGFSLVIMNDKVSNLPTECQIFINVTANHSDLFENVLNANSQKFQIDYQTPLQLKSCCHALANIPVEVNQSSEKRLPEKVGFLEMYNVGKVEQLNSVNRWKKNNPILTLQAPLGIGNSGEKVSLDLHEKFHGPHGLIAGMTGSGKSEFLITYILSLAVNYHPDEVQFILIDYKGGGLAGAFENNDTGRKLPHLAGTITNLDTNEIKRSLASIESELRRRQREFNKARELSGDSTIDIYKYQQLYRNGVVSEPISHLFIISDEFAELKSQQQEFMQQLISAARIGRSLGIHLILATQKPSGVVDNQIWSNTRFRVCLRVQEKADSVEVIQCPDAAFLKTTGRFYLQVGYNEIFIMGQAAWAGRQYVPTEKLRKKEDTSIEFIDDIGFVTKRVDVTQKADSVVALGEELTNVVNYLISLGEEEQIKAKQLWLPAIPAYVSVESLRHKYTYEREPFILNPMIGEYDVPTNQEQHLLTLPLCKEGNALVYGITGSGKENFLSTMFYSSITSYTSDEVSFYLIDFGTEMLRSFKEAPQFGDILYVSDVEKLENLFKMLVNMIDERKKLFSMYNGDYVNYCKISGKSEPSVVVVINNYEAYVETFPEYDDVLSQLTREGTKYGIYFVITLNSPSGMRFKLSQNFTQQFVLQQNNEADYATILGNIHKNFPSKLFGRGIIRDEDIYEFQTAMPAPKDEISVFIKNTCQKLKEANGEKRARPVPMLPSVVSYTSVASSLPVNSLAIGYSKEDLRIVSHDIFHSFTQLILSQDLVLAVKLLIPMLHQIVVRDMASVLVLNADGLEFGNKESLGYSVIDRDFDQIFENIKHYIEEHHEIYVKTKSREAFKDETPMLIVIAGIDSFKNQLSSDNQLKFSTIFEKGKDLGILHILLVDSVDRVKRFELESWYKTAVNPSQGIWVGSGIAEQFSMKIGKITKELREEIPDNFCYVVERGKPTLVKYIEKI